MALAGTKNTIQHLVEKTKARKVHPVKAAIALKSLVNTRVVSEKQIEIVMELCKHQVSQRSPILRQSCYLTVGSMINNLCSESEDQLALEFKTNAQKFCPLYAQAEIRQGIVFSSLLVGFRSVSAMRLHVVYVGLGGPCWYDANEIR